MSSTYVTEPPTKGKVILKTTIGDLEIELWPKEAPKAVRNFMQLCLEGFYHDTIFHRIISGFMAQGGDPTGTGGGSDSIYGGQPFEDEFHSRLRFTHRGLVACANQNSPHTNSCQFFITLDACEFLTRKNTIFGKVVGDTIYNVQRMNELETDEDDKPIDPPMITDIDVVWNPFEDIVPRTNIEERRAAKEETKKPKKKKAKKALNLLSFGDDAAEDEQELASMGAAGKIKSAHDAIEDARFLRDDDAEAQRRMEEEEDEHERRKARNAVRDALKRKEESAKALTMEERLRAKVQQSKESSKTDKDGATGTAAEGPGRNGGGGEEEEGEAPPAAEETEKAAKKRKQREFREQLREREDDLADKRGAAPRRPQQRVENAELLTAWQRSRAEFKQKKRLTGAREKETLAKLQKFRSKVAVPGAPKASPSRKEGPEGAEQQEEEKEPSRPKSGGGEGAEEGEDDGYHGKVRDDIDHRDYMPAAWRIDDYLTLDDDDEDAGIESLRSHKLVFSKSKGKDEMARVDNLDDYVVHDPLVEKQKEKFNKVQQRNKKKQTEWAGRAMT